MYTLEIVLIVLQSPSWFMKCLAINIWYWRKQTSNLYPWQCVQLPTYPLEEEETIITEYFSTKILFEERNFHVLEI